MAKRICVIGAGPAGLCFAHAAAHQGLEVELFEGHSKPGGSASFFRRKTPAGVACFDAGATVLWGMRNEEDLLTKLFKKWQINGLEFISHNQLQCSLSPSDHITLDSNSPEAWVRSLELAFPNENRELWKGMRQLSLQAQRLNELLSSGPHAPLEDLNSAIFNLRLIPKILPLSIEVITGLKHSFSSKLDDWHASARFRRWVDMNLLITLQDTSQNVHPLYAALALFFYPLGAGSVKGGMFQFFDSLKRELNNNAKVHMRNPVLGIEKQNGHFLVRTKEELHEPFDIVVSSIPRFNTQDLFGNEKIDDHSWEKQRTKVWGALVGYLVIKDNPRLPNAPFNHHAYCEKKGEFYFSFSQRGDEVRAPIGYRTVTFSTHSLLSDWTGESSSYAELKVERGSLGLKVFSERFPEVEVIFKEYGTPKTFERYTKRKEGFVGGLPLNYDNTFFNSPSIRTKIPNLYQIGDTSFPGQSVFGCAVGALLCLEKITGHRQFPKD